MRAVTITDKIFRWMFFLALLGAGGAAYGSGAPAWKSEAFSLGKAGEISLPLRITPVLVEAPARRVDLLPGRAEDKSAGGIKPDADGTGLPLTGLPVDLHEYPVLNFSAAGQEPGLNWIELALDTRGKGAVDALVRVGDPALFPDMVKERIDFRAAEFAARDTRYKIKRALGIGGDGKWRYTAINARVGGIANGIVDASFGPGGDLVLQRAFDSTDLAKTPWLRYEYELPRGLPWIVQINAKVDAGGLSPKLTTLFSKQVRGGGKQKLLVNLHDLLQKTNPDARDGRLEELIIHFTLDETAGAAIRNAAIDLGRLEFYDAQKSNPGSQAPIILVAAGSASVKINLLEVLEKRLSPPTNKLMVLSGRLVGAPQHPPGVLEGFPKISLLAPYREKIPKLFAGEGFFLNELNAQELSAVLDQRMFLEKQRLWETGKSEVIFLKPDGVTLPLASYAQDTRIEGNAYIKTDYSYEGGGQFPLYLTLTGIDQHGRPVESDYSLLKNRPLRIKDIRIKKITLSFRREGDTAAPIPAFCIIKNIQISTFKKTTVYRPQSAVAHVGLDGGTLPTGKLVWRANSERFNINLPDSDNIQIVQAFPVEEKIAGDAVIKYDLEPQSGENLAFFLRARGQVESGETEKLFAISQRGVVLVPDMVLRGLDIMVKGDAAVPVSVLLNQLEVHSMSKESELVNTDKLDATLSYTQILEGGKTIVLPKTFFGKGEHRLNYVAAEDVSIAIDQSFLLSNRDLLNTVSLKAKTGKAAPSKLAKMGLLLILAGGLVWLLGVKFMPGWTPLVDRALSGELAYLNIQFVLLFTAFYMMFISDAKEAFSWGGLLLAFAYGLAVRYRIRPSLVKKWVFFSERHSAPYFLLFLAFVLSCAVMLMFKLEAAAEHAAAIGYYLLVTGVTIEFIRFSKEPWRGPPAPDSNEKVPSVNDAR